MKEEDNETTLFTKFIELIKNIKDDGQTVESKPEDF